MLMIFNFLKLLSFLDQPLLSTNHGVEVIIAPDHIVRHTHTHTHTLRRTPLHEESARRRDLYLTTHNPHKGQTSMSAAGFEPAIPAGVRSQTHAIDSAASGIGHHVTTWEKSINLMTLEDITFKSNGGTTYTSCS